jgi:hypothetical protein
MTAKTVAYWAATAIVAGETLAGAVVDLTHGRQKVVSGKPVADIVTQLGSPLYVLATLGVLKVAGAVVLFAPRLPRLKEWAYAGVMFDLTSAAASHALRRNSAGEALAPLVLAAFALASWALRPPSRTLGAISPATANHRPPSSAVGPARDTRSMRHRDTSRWRSTEMAVVTNVTSSAASSRSRTIAYWGTTGVLAAECLVGGALGLLRWPSYVGIMRRLGFPPYVMTILGIWYGLAGVALLVPRFPRLKEWAYAGLVFIYTGAAASHLAVGDRAAALVAPVVFTALTTASWAPRPSSRRDLAAGRLGAS